eukprot:scaffold306073_cov17-Prasinocladus_malaysianus.AAC.1
MCVSRSTGWIEPIFLHLSLTKEPEFNSGWQNLESGTRYADSSTSSTPGLSCQSGTTPGSTPESSNEAGPRRPRSISVAVAEFP